MDKNFISEKASIGENFSIGMFCNIEDGVIIGNNVTLKGYCTIGKGTVLGDGCTIEEFTKIGAHSSIGEQTFVGTYSKIGDDAKVGSHVRMTSYCEIRSNCVVGDYSTFGSRCTLSAGTIVEDHVIVKYGFVATDTPVLGVSEKKTCVLKSRSKYGANVTIMPAITIGINSEIGSCSQVRNDVGDNEVWYGNPAKFFRKC